MIETAYFSGGLTLDLHYNEPRKAGLGRWPHGGWEGSGVGRNGKDSVGKVLVTHV